MKLYLAHPIVLRHEIRKIELAIEEATGYMLLNPFYDANREKKLEDLDSGKITLEEYISSLSPFKIVEGDLDLIDSSDGTVAYLDKTIQMLGTHCEMWYTLEQDMPVYVVSSNSLSHPWVRYIIQQSSGRGFDDWLSFEAWLRNC